MEIVGQHDSWLVMLIREWVIITAVWSTHIKLPCWETEKDGKVWQRRAGMSRDKRRWILVQWRLGHRLIKIVLQSIPWEIIVCLNDIPYWWVWRFYGATYKVWSSLGVLRLPGMSWWSNDIPIFFIYKLYFMIYIAFRIHHILWMKNVSISPLPSWFAACKHFYYFGQQNQFWGDNISIWSPQKKDCWQFHVM